MHFRQEMKGRVLLTSERKPPEITSCTLYTLSTCSFWWLPQYLLLHISIWSCSSHMTYITFRLISTIVLVTMFVELNSKHIFKWHLWSTIQEINLPIRYVIFINVMTFVPQTYQNNVHLSLLQYTLHKPKGRSYLERDIIVDFFGREFQILNLSEYWTVFI